MTIHVQLQPNKPALSFDERMKLFVKPSKPRKAPRGFFQNASGSGKVQAEAASSAVQVKAEGQPRQSKANTPQEHITAEVFAIQEKAVPQVQARSDVHDTQAKVLPASSAHAPVHISLKDAYERVQQELSQVYKQGKQVVPRTPADQMVFIQSYQDLGEHVRTIYTQGTGEQPPCSDEQWRTCYSETIALLHTLYGLAQQSPEALEQIKRLSHQFYAQARKRQSQGVLPQKTQVSPSVPVQVKNPPPIDPKRIPTAAQPAQPTVPPPTHPASVQPAQIPGKQPAPPIARRPTMSVDQSSSQHGTSQRQQGTMAQMAPPVQPPQPNAQPRVSPPPATVQAMPQPHNPPPIPPAQNHPPMSVVPANGAPAHPARRDDSRHGQQPYQRDRQSWDPRISRREYLLRERLFLERDIQRILGEANAINERWQIWSATKAQLERNKTLVPVKEVFSFVARRLIKIPLPSAARNISYQEARLQHEATWLQQQAIAMNNRYNARLQEIHLIDTELGMLHF